MAQQTEMSCNWKQWTEAFCGFKLLTESWPQSKGSRHEIILTFLISDHPVKKGFSTDNIIQAILFLSIGIVKEKHNILYIFFCI